MITTILLLSLLLLFNNSIRQLTKKLKAADRKRPVRDTWDMITSCLKKAARFIARIILRFHYAIKMKGSSIMDIRRKTETVLEEWFGPEIITGFVADFRDKTDVG